MKDKTYSVFNSQNIDEQIKTAEALIQQQKETERSSANVF